MEPRRKQVLFIIENSLSETSFFLTRAVINPFLTTTVKNELNNNAILTIPNCSGLMSRAAITRTTNFIKVMEIPPNPVHNMAFNTPAIIDIQTSLLYTPCLEHLKDDLPFCWQQ